MEMIISSHSFDTEFGYEDRNSILESIDQELSQLNSEYSIEDFNIGRGADFPGVLVTIASVFYVIKEINYNIDSILSLSKKIQAVIFAIKRFASIRIDSEGSLHITLGLIASHTPEGINNIKLRLSEVIKGEPWPIGRIDSVGHFPEALYLNVVEADNDIFVSVVRSNGNIEIFKKMPGLAWLNFR